MVNLNLNQNQNQNPWVVTETPKQEPLPSGSYNGAFREIEPITLATTREARWRFVWEVTEGPYKGRIATALTEVGCNKAHLNGRLLAGLLGRDLVAGENLQAAVDACKGHRYLLIVQPGPKGGKPMVRHCAKLPA